MERVQLALRLSRLPFGVKLAVYLMLVWGLHLVDGLAAASSLVLLPFLAWAHPSPVRTWIRHSLRFWPVAALPLVAWLFGALTSGGVGDWEIAVGRALRFWSLFLVSDWFSGLIGPIEIRRALGFWPPAALATSLFLTYLAWLRSELAVLREAASLRGRPGGWGRLRLGAQILLNLTVRGMEHARDKGDALLLRESSLTERGGT